jgi:hypothetical protein
MWKWSNSKLTAESNALSGGVTEEDGMGNSITIINPRTGVGGTITTLPTARSSDTIIIAESSPILPLDGPFHGHGTPDAAKFDTGSAPQPAQPAPADGKGMTTNNTFINNGTINTNGGDSFAGGKTEQYGVKVSGNNNQVIVAQNGATVIATQDNSRNNGDFVSGNKTEQVGVKGDNNTVGGSIDQHIGTQGKSAKKKFWTIKKIAAIIASIVAFLAGLVTIAQWFQSHQSTKPPAEESQPSEVPTVITPEEELSNPVLRNDGEDSHD